MNVVSYGQNTLPTSADSVNKNKPKPQHQYQDHFTGLPAELTLSLSIYSCSCKNVQQNTTGLFSFFSGRTCHPYLPICVGTKKQTNLKIARTSHAASVFLTRSHIVVWLLLWQFYTNRVCSKSVHFFPDLLITAIFQFHWDSTLSLISAVQS